MRRKLIRSLEQYQRWRKGAEIPMPHPSEVRMMMENCIRILEHLSDEQVNEILYEQKNS